MLSKIAALSAALALTSALLPASPGYVRSSGTTYTTVKASAYTLGDVNGDSTPNAVDASRVLIEAAQVSAYGLGSFTAEQTLAADVTSDGLVNAADASMILIYSAYAATGGQQHIGEYIQQLKLPVSVSSVPAYDGEPYAVVNGNTPYFDAWDYDTSSSFELYSDLDSLGRCRTVVANVGLDTMPTEDRGSISSVTPSGWHSITYDCVPGGYLYNRCHLIGYQLTAENANECNLITGTRYLNVEGMLPFEDMTADYIYETGNHVLYRVTPIYDGDDLLASGVLMEAYSVEDAGAGICYSIYCYNVQPDITIDYSSGESWLTDAESTTETTITTTSVTTTTTTTTSTTTTTTTAPPETTVTVTVDPSAITYVCNTKTLKFHYSDCYSAGKISAENYMAWTGTREELVALGYTPCGNCDP